MRRAPLVRAAPVGHRLSLLLLLVAGVATAVNVAVPGVFRGPEVMNGSAIGTSLVILVAALPTIGLGMYKTDRGSTWAALLWLGGLVYVAYNSMLLVFMTPFNSLFLLYVAMLSLSVWAIVAVASRFDASAFAAEVTGALPARAIAVYVLVVVALNALTWLAAIVPAMLSSGEPKFLAGTGTITNTVHVNDLAFALPIMAVAAFWLWERRPWGLAVIGSMLVFWQIEAIGVATDQWFGHHADPTSTVAGMAAVYLFAGLAVINLVPTFFYFRSLRRPR